MNKNYCITKKQCLSYIHGVCSHCGGKLEAMETVDNANNPTFWAGCKHCSRFDWGVKKEDFELAKKLVREFGYYPYSHMDKHEYEQEGNLEYFYEQQAGGAFPLIYWLKKNGYNQRIIKGGKNG